MLCVCKLNFIPIKNKKHELENTLVRLKDFKKELENYDVPENLGGWSLSNLPTHFWETLGECITDIEEYIKMMKNIDKKLIISDVNDSISFEREFFNDIDFVLHNDKLELYVGGFTKGWLNKDEIESLFNFLKKYYH